jgi:hypothetical protein
MRTLFAATKLTLKGYRLLDQAMATDPLVDGSLFEIKLFSGGGSPWTLSGRFRWLTPAPNWEPIAE